jgi:hypothetical protein
MNLTEQAIITDRFMGFSMTSNKMAAVLWK